MWTGHTFLSPAETTKKRDSPQTTSTEDRQKLPRLPWISQKLFYGWVIVAVGAASQIFQGIVTQGFTTYLGPLRDTFGWSAAVLAGPRSVTQVQSSILGPIEGFLVDRLGPRRVVTTGIFFMGLGLILFGLTQSLWLYYLSNIIIAAGTGLQGLLVMSVAVNNWFRRKRSIAQSVMLLGYPAAGAVFVPLLVLIQNLRGWQVSAIASGLFIWAAGFPVTFLLRTMPEQYGLLPDGESTDTSPATGEVDRFVSQEHDFTLSEAIRTRAFWFLAIGWAIGNLGLSAANVHLFLHLVEGVGLERTTAALVWTVASLSNVPSRLAGGLLGDRLPKNIMVGLSMIFIAVSVYVLAIATSAQMAFSYAVLFGIGWGVRTPVMNAMQGEYFGRASQGIIRGWLQSVSIPFTVAAPVVAGYMFDIQGNYRDTFVVLSFIMLAGALLIFLAIPPKHPHHAEEPLS